jgi:hypothetical protein
MPDKTVSGLVRNFSIVLLGFAAGSHAVSTLAASAAPTSNNSSPWAKGHSDIVELEFPANLGKIQADELVIELLGAGRGKFRVKCSAGASDDPYCEFRQVAANGKSSRVHIHCCGNQEFPGDEDLGRFQIPAQKLILPGDGSIVSHNAMDTFFKTRRLLRWKNATDGFAEVPQPFLLVSLNSKVLKPTWMYGDRSLHDKIQQLKTGETVQVLLQDSSDKKLYLVANAAQITGWVRVVPELGTTTPFEGLIFNGD